MAVITLDNVLFYKTGTSGADSVVGYESNARRVVRYTFTAPAIGASEVSLTVPTTGLGGGSHIPIRFFIGTSYSSHVNAGPESEYTGTLTLGSDNLTFTGSANIVLIPDQKYYLWIFPGEDTFGWYGWNSSADAVTLTTSGVVVAEVVFSGKTLGSLGILFLRRTSDILSYTIIAECGNESLVIAEKTDSNYFTWTPPSYWRDQNPTGNSVSVKITCTTYNGSVEVGSTSAIYTLAIPSTEIQIEDLSVTDDAGYLDQYGSYIQLKSRAKVTVTAVGVNGGEVKNVTVTCGNLSGSGTNLVFELPKAGDIKITVTATDSKGRTVSRSQYIEVAAYSLPTASISSVYRCDAGGNEDEDAGQYASVTFSASVAPFEDSNVAKYVLKYRVHGASNWSSVDLSDLDNTYAPENYTRIVQIESDAAHDVCIEITDMFGPVESAYRTVRAAFAMMDVDKANKAIGFGMRAIKENAAAFGLPVWLDAGLMGEQRSGGTADTDESELNSWLDTQLVMMETSSVKYVCFWCAAVSDNMVHGFLFKHSSYAFFVGWTYSAKEQYHKIKYSDGWENTTVHSLA